jgi:tetraacyldisaccharide 4'-kinase
MKVAKGVLTLASILYQTAIRLRHYLYDHQILSARYAPLPVVSIGNVACGGVGKTQVALLLAEQLARDVRVAILSRGYLGEAEGAREPLAVDCRTHSAQICGDEPWLLASRLDSTLVIVNKNRFKSALKAKQLGAQLLLLDDGMQHRKLHRDLEIVVIDGKTPFGAFLPKGRRREELGRLKIADLILFVGSPEKATVKELSQLSHAPQVVAKIGVSGVFWLTGEPIGPLKGKAVAIFCAIGNPTRFVKTVEELGACVVATHFSPDHRRAAEKSLQKFSTLAKQRGATLLLCTEKDKVKLPHMQLPLPIGWIKTDLEIVENQESWIKIVDEMKLLASRSP